MTCSQCGFDNPEGMAFCGQCGSRLYRRTGDRAKAQEHLTTATALFREMDMRFWLDQAELTLRERG